MPRVARHSPSLHHIVTRHYGCNITLLQPRSELMGKEVKRARILLSSHSRRLPSSRRAQPSPLPRKLAKFKKFQKDECPASSAILFLSTSSLHTISVARSSCLSLFLIWGEERCRERASCSLRYSRRSPLSLGAKKFKTCNNFRMIEKSKKFRNLEKLKRPEKSAKWQKSCSVFLFIANAAGSSCFSLFLT